jgi:hypothetical protein
MPIILYRDLKCEGFQLCSQLISTFNIWSALITLYSLTSRNNTGRIFSLYLNDYARQDGFTAYNDQLLLSQ